VQLRKSVTTKADAIRIPAAAQEQRRSSVRTDREVGPYQSSFITIVNHGPFQCVIE
jgi:hypothetical protein